MTQATASIQHWNVGTAPTVLESIHEDHISLAIYQRDVGPMADEIKYMLEQGIELRLSGEPDVILSDISKAIDQKKCGLLIKDIHDLLGQFSQLTQADGFKLLLLATNSNMCRKFHTDFNSLRMLCTYSGAGTLWLKEGDIDPEAIESGFDNEKNLLEEGQIQQAETGAVLILKGALYPSNSNNAIVHRSPTIEESGGRRLMLRIDANGAMNFDI